MCDGRIEKVREIRKRREGERQWRGVTTLNFGQIQTVYKPFINRLNYTNTVYDTFTVLFTNTFTNFIGKAGFFTFSPIFYFIVIRYFFPFHSKNWIAQSTSLFYHSISTPFLPPHYNIHFIIASSIFISHQNLSPNHVRMPSPMQRFKKSMLPGHFQSTFQCSRSFSISPYYNRF